MVGRCVVSLILLVQVTFGGWRRQIYMPQGTWSDAAPARALPYFRVSPCARSDQKDRVVQCALNVQVEELSNTTTKLRYVGSVGELRAYDLFYFANRKENEEPYMRSVLVGTTLNLLHEVLVQTNGPLGAVFPTKILQVGEQSIIKVKSDDGGIYHFVHEDYFVVVDGVALLLDFGPAFQAADRSVPKGMQTWQPASEFNFKRMVYVIGTEPFNSPPKISCCNGRIEVPFQIEPGRISAGHGNFFPGRYWPQ